MTSTVAHQPAENQAHSLGALARRMAQPDFDRRTPPARHPRAFARERAERPPVNATFNQSAVAALERAALYLFRHLSVETGEQLSDALEQVRRDLDLPFPFFSWRDWPDDAQAGDALGALLRRLDELERP